MKVDLSPRLTQQKYRTRKKHMGHNESCTSVMNETLFLFCPYDQTLWHVKPLNSISTPFKMPYVHRKYCHHSAFLTFHATGILGSPKFTKASAHVKRSIAAFQDTRWFINTFTYFALSFCPKVARGLLS